MKRFALPIILLLSLVAVLWVFFQQEEKADTEETSSNEPPEVVTMLAEKEGTPPGVTLMPGGENGPPTGGVDRPPTVPIYNNRSLMQMLAELAELSDEERLKQIADLLESPYPEERAIGAIAAYEEGTLSEGMMADLATDPDAFVPLQLMGWMRDGLDSESIAKMVEGFREREDYSMSSLKLWARDSDTSAPAGRALLDMLALEVSGDSLQSELQQIAFSGMAKAANPEIRIEAVIRVAEVMDPLDYSRQLSQARKNLPEVTPIEPDPSIRPGSPEALGDHRKRTQQYEEKVFASQLQVQATRYNKPPQIIESQGTPLGPAQFSGAWNMTGLRDLDYLASLAERAVKNQETVQAGSVSTIQKILEEAPTRNPTAEYSYRQAYDVRRLEAALPQLRQLEDSTAVIDAPPGAAPPGAGPSGAVPPQG